MTAFPIIARERPLSGRKRKGWSWPGADGTVVAAGLNVVRWTASRAHAGATAALCASSGAGVAGGTPSVAFRNRVRRRERTQLNEFLTPRTGFEPATCGLTGLRGISRFQGLRPDSVPQFTRAAANLRPEGADSRTFLRNAETIACTASAREAAASSSRPGTLHQLDLRSMPSGRSQLRVARQ
jgi:hypothetical protein